MSRKMNAGSLTAAQVAELAGVGRSIVVKMTRLGKLKCWQIPGSGRRHYGALAVREFVRRIGAPTDAVDKLIAGGE